MDSHEDDADKPKSNDESTQLYVWYPVVRLIILMNLAHLAGYGFKFSIFWYIVDIKYLQLRQFIIECSQMQATHKPATTELKLSQIIQLILQFLQENNLPQTYKTLQEESQICLNIIDRKYLESIIMEGRWEVLFKQLNYITLSQETLFDLYQLILDDLIDKDAFQAAHFVYKQCLAAKFGDYRERSLRIQYICEHTQQKAMYHKPPTLQRKENIMGRILNQTHQQVERSRLLTLITSALKFEASKGVIMPNLSYSVLQGKCNTIETEVEQLITKTEKILRYAEDTRVTCISMSNKGQYIALGGIDGLIQIYEPLQYTLDTSSLKYQAEGIMLYHDNSVEHMIFNETDELLASADSKSVIKVWSMESGRLLRKIEYSTPIGCCSWGIDASQLLMGYQNVQMYGIRGCNLLKQYLCGSGSGEQYLKQIAVSTSDMHGGRLFVFGQLGTIRSYNYKTQQQINILHLSKKTPEYGQLVKVISKSTKQHSLIFHLCFGKCVVSINQKLQQVSKYEINGSGDRIQLVNIAYSNAYIYECIRKEDGKHVLQARDSGSRRIMHAKEIESAVSMMDVHCRRNLLVMYGVANVLSFWRP